MQGFIKLEAVPTEDGSHISGEIAMTGVGLVDKVKLLYAFCTSLEIDDAAIMTMIAVREMLDKSTEQVKIDMGAIRKFTECESESEDE